jgi:hypothetical protein
MVTTICAVGSPPQTTMNEQEQQLFLQLYDFPTSENRDNKVKRIIDAWKEKGGCLDLSNLSLKTLPSFSLDVTELRISGNIFTSIPEISHFSEMVVLNCASNFLTGLPTLPSKLRELICARNKLKSLPHLPETLETLIRSHNHSNFVLPDHLPITLKYLTFTHLLITQRVGTPYRYIREWDRNYRDAGCKYFVKIHNQRQSCRIKYRTQRIKEELMQVCWHPKGCEIDEL